jgi:hypothetical protein
LIKLTAGFSKVRYRGLAKSLKRAQNMFGLANLYQVRRQQLAAQTRCGCVSEQPRTIICRSAV